MLRAALPYFVYEETGSTVATAGMIVAALAPGVLAGSFVGVFADRWNRKRILVGTSLAQAAVVLLLLAVATGSSLWPVYVVAALQALVGSLALPAETALLPMLVDDDELVAANSLNALNNRLGRLVGAPAGGIVLTVAGLEAVVLLDCISFLAAAALVAPIVVPRRSTAGAGAASLEAAASRWSSFWHEWAAGLRIVLADRSIGVLFLVLGVMTFAGTMIDPLNVAWVRDVLRAGPDVFALLIATHAATGILGTLLVGRFGARVAAHRLIGWTGLAAAAATAVKYDVPALPVALLTTGVVGVTSVASSVGVETLAMRTVRDEYRGRVFGSLNATTTLLSLVGAATAGLLGEVVGIVPMLNVAAVLVAVSAVVVLWSFRRPVTRARPDGQAARG